MIRKPEASVFRVRSNVRFVLAVEADDAARLFDVVVAGDGDEEQVELGNVLDQFDRRAVGQFAVEDDHVRVPVADVLDAEGDVASRYQAPAGLHVVGQARFKLVDQGDDALLHVGSQIGRFRVVFFFRYVAGLYDSQFLICSCLFFGGLLFFLIVYVCDKNPSLSFSLYH